MEKTVSQITDSATGIVYKVITYRPITRSEMVRLIATHKAENKGKSKLPPGHEVVITTEIGLHDA